MPDDPSMLDQAARRLEAALARLEGRVRAAAEASAALGRAAAEVRAALEAEA